MSTKPNPPRDSIFLINLPANASCCEFLPRVYVTNVPILACNGSVICNDTDYDKLDVFWLLSS